MKKLHCKNCGTTIKDTDMSCPICHMKPDRTVEEEKKVEENIIHNNNKKIILKFVIAGLLVVGLVLTFMGFMHLNDITYCQDGDCSSKNLFILLLGLALMISSIITLFRFKNK